MNWNKHIPNEQLPLRKGRIERSSWEKRRRPSRSSNTNQMMTTASKTQRMISLMLILIGNSLLNHLRLRLFRSMFRRISIMISSCEKRTFHHKKEIKMRLLSKYCWIWWRFKNILSSCSRIWFSVMMITRERWTTCSSKKSLRTLLRTVQKSKQVQILTKAFIQLKTSLILWFHNLYQPETVNLLFS